jgi:lysozyme family protein
MLSTFDPAFRLLLRHEGGFSNSSSDPGGPTNLGVTQRQWESYVGHQVSIDDMKALTPNMVEHFYKSRYWDVVQADKLPAGIDDCLFDCCVNSGPGRAVMILQGILGVVEDGILGPNTIAAISAQPAHTTIPDYCEARLAFLQTLPTWPVFGKGWTTRVNGVEQEALAFAGQEKAQLIS